MREALFASHVQASDQPDPQQISMAITCVLEEFGPQYCAERVAEEYGDHPETAPMRMCWARATAAALDSWSVPRIRRMAAADSSVSGRKPLAGLSAIRSA